MRNTSIRCRKTLSIPEVAARFGLPISTVQDAVNMGACPVWYADSPDGERRFRESDLPEFAGILTVLGKFDEVTVKPGVGNRAVRKIVY